MYLLFALHNTVQLKGIPSYKMVESSFSVAHIQIHIEYNELYYPHTRYKIGHMFRKYCLIDLSNTTLNLYTVVYKMEPSNHF